MVVEEGRRLADTVLLQHIWNTLIQLKKKRQFPTADNVCKYLLREYDDVEENDIRETIEHGLSDKLLGRFTKEVSSEEKTGYKILPLNELPEKDDHDWYCFECHKPGNVVSCADCWRVFHIGCTEEDTSGEIFKCTICNCFKIGKQKDRWKRKKLNKFLQFAAQRLIDQFDTLRAFDLGEEDHLTPFIRRFMDLNAMQIRCRANKYKYFEQFLADAQLIMHNVLICFGTTSINADMARIMVRDCKHDLCQDCYFYSNAKPEDWFCKPCWPRHELVYAKQKGFPYWPSKVIHVSSDDVYDVRFFGGAHERSVLPKSGIKPITASAKELNLKKNAGMTKALKELEIHQAMADKAAEERPLFADEEGDDADSGDDIHQEEVPIPRKSDQDKVHEDDVETQEYKEDAEVSEEEEEQPEKEPSVDEKPKSKPKTPKTEVNNDEVDDDYQFDGDEPDEDEDDYKPVNIKKRKKQQLILKLDHGHGKKKARMSLPAQLKADDRVSSSLSPSKNKPGRKRKATVDADDTNLVTSSDSLSSHKKGSSIRKSSRYTQTDAQATDSLKEFKVEVKGEDNGDIQRAMKELEERLRRDFDREKATAVNRVQNTMTKEVERVRKQTETKLREEFEEEMAKAALKHKQEVLAVKKKQWCYNCEEEAMYHCCWNTSYCSIKCQQDHWHGEHKRMCRRKR